MALKFSIGLFALLLLLKPALGQDTISSQHYISLTWDDDFLNLAGQGTDKGYTNGLYIQYSFLRAHRKPAYYTIGLTQWMYTPNNLKMSNAVKGDYPYCGILFLNLSRETQPTRRSLFRSEVWLGTIGPNAGSGPVQAFVHRVINDQDPEGWKNQMPGYPVINYNVYYEQNLASAGHFLHLNGLAYGQIGSLLNTASVGANLLITNERDSYFPDRMYTLHNNAPGKTWRLYAEVTPLLRFVAYNSILQGGLFEQKDFYHIKQSQLERLIFEGAVQFGIRLKNFDIHFRQTIDTREFKTVIEHTVGTLGISWKV